MFLKLDDTISVSPQISTDDVVTAAALGFTGVINNRPDDEQPGQPSSAEIAAAAAAAGLRYTAVPTTMSDLRQDQVDAMAAALAAADGPVLAFCRSGTRSTWLWALARVTQGEDVEALIEKAGAQGYDLAALRGMVG